jgi:hypothetical protein
LLQKAFCGDVGGYVDRRSIRFAIAAPSPSDPTVRKSDLPALAAE